MDKKQAEQLRDHALEIENQLLMSKTNKRFDEWFWKQSQYTRDMVLNQFEAYHTAVQQMQKTTLVILNEVN